MKSLEPFDIIALVLAAGLIIIIVLAIWLEGNRIDEEAIDIFDNTMTGIVSILTIYMTDRLINRGK